MPDIICRMCGKRDFKDWGELAQHINSFKDTKHKNKASKLWAKRYIHRNAIDKLKKIGNKKELEPRQALTEKQLEAKREAKYVLSGQTKLVPIKCPRCKKGSRDFLPVEHVNEPTALKDGECYIIICEGCK
jgi:phage FluMu protein Com